MKKIAARIRQYIYRKTFYKNLDHSFYTIKD